MKKYVIAGGLNLEALQKNINYYAEYGFKVIPPILQEKGKGTLTTWNILMELQISDNTAEVEE